MRLMEPTAFSQSIALHDALNAIESHDALHDAPHDAPLHDALHDMRFTMHSTQLKHNVEVASTPVVLEFTDL